MGYGKPNSDDNAPASTSPLQEHDEFALTVSRDGAADCSGILHGGRSSGADHMSFPYMSLSAVPSPWENHAMDNTCMHDIAESSGNLIHDFIRLNNSLQNPHIDPNSINIRSNRPTILGPEISFPEWNMRGIHHSINHDFMMTPGNVKNGGANVQTNRNFMPTRGNAAGGYQMTRQGGEATSSNINWPQSSGDFVSFGGGTPMLYHTQNNAEIEIGSNVKVSADQFSCSEKIDGSFLSLGIGGSTEARSKSTFSRQEIASKLEEAVSPKLNVSHVGQTTRSSSSLVHNLPTGFPSFQSNAGGFSSLACNVGGWTSSNNDVGVIRGANTGISSSPFHVLQAPQVDIQHNISMPSNRNRFFRDNQAASSEAISSSLAGFLGSRQIGMSRLASESANSMWITTQTTSDQLQNCYMNTAKNSSPESTMNSPFLRLRGSSTRWDHSGPSFPASEDSLTQAAEKCHFPRRMVPQPAGKLFSANDGTAAQAGASLFPNRTGVQVSEGSAAQSATGVLFPKRLGVQVNEGATAQAGEGYLFPKGMGVQTASQLGQPQDSGSVQLPKNLRMPSFATGQTKDEVPAQFSVDFRGFTSTTGQSQYGAPVRFSDNIQRPLSTAGRVIPVAKVNGPPQASGILGRPPLKRSAVRPPPITPWVQRRKITAQPPIPHPMAYPPWTAPAPAPASALPRIKWQGFDGPHQPTGQKCLLCKRDLSFTPEGPVLQPTVPPAVAVLPCGHTFHDHCLHIITPDDQSKNPPCIPCAIGEN